MSVAYPFILDIEGYPTQIINVFVVIVCLPPLPQILSHVRQFLYRDSFGCAGKGQIFIGRLKVSVVQTETSVDTRCPSLVASGGVLSHCGGIS